MRTDLYREAGVTRPAQYPDSRIVAVVLGAFPPLSQQ